MNKYKVPFKTNVNQPVPELAAHSSGRPAQVRKTNDGYWLRSQERPIVAYLANEKMERKQHSKWILTWVAAVPLGCVAMVWIAVLFTDLFTT